MSRVHTENVRKTIKCEICGKNVGKDVKSHLCKKSIPCKACGKMYFNRKERDKHQKEEHAEIAQSYSCDQCGVTFNTKSSLNKHIKNIHAEESECPYCGKKCKNLQFHIDTAHVSDEMKGSSVKTVEKAFYLNIS